LVRLGARNALRHTRRSALTAVAIAVAVTALIFYASYVAGVVDDLLDTYARTESGHVRVRREGYAQREHFLPAHLHLREVESLLAELAREPGVRDAVPRIRTFALVDGAESNKPGVLLGVDLAREEDYLRPAGMVASGRLPDAGRAEALVGERFAEQLGVGVGDSLTLLAQTAYRSLGGLRVAVVGIAHTGVAYLDASLVVVPLGQAQLLLDLEGGATELVVFARDPGQADSLAGAIGARLGGRAGPLEVRSWREQGPLVRLADLMGAMMALLMLLLFGMAALVIVNTMLMTVLERRREYATQAALGMRRGDLIRQVMVEAAVIGLAGAVAGALVGSAAALWFERVGIDFTSAAHSIDLPFESVVHPDWKLRYAVGMAAAGVAVAGLAAFIPAWRVARLQPAAALRT
jgi:putative ABC transport system permease protein